ncbi:RluA family pseudouridine synthase [Candidatus Saccharibacteria bacterium]|nr:RluA family pseudouridine synthase [Candidatus Saccharibacteria bacterium]
MYLIQITEDFVGRRTDKLLAEQLPQFPRAALQKLFEKDLILLNNKITKPGIKVRLGDRLKADLSPLDIKIDDIELPIIYEDEDTLVINKPSGVISHARGRYFDEPSVASFIRQNTHQSGERAGIAHRLDRATSGVMICAKNQSSLSWLQKQFSLRKVKKTYIAIILGEMPSEDGIIDMPIGRNPKKPQTFHVTELGKTAVTRYKVIQKTDLYSMLELQPETGRTHQLRVHLQALKHPIVGDSLYGGKESLRLLLHAKDLEIILPNNKQVTFTAPITSEFIELLNV